MNNVLLTEFLNDHPFAQDTIFKVIKGNNQKSSIKIVVYYEDKMFNGKRSIFALFINNHMVIPVIKMYCSIDMEDVVKISKAILEEYIEANNKRLKENLFDDENLTSLCISQDYNFKSLSLWNDKYGYKSQRHKEEANKLIVDILRECFNGDEDDMDYIEDLVEYIKTTYKK